MQHKTQIFFKSKISQNGKYLRILRVQWGEPDATEMAMILEVHGMKVVLCSAVEEITMPLNFLSIGREHCRSTATVGVPLRTQGGPSKSHWETLDHWAAVLTTTVQTNHIEQRIPQHYGELVTFIPKSSVIESDISFVSLTQKKLMPLTWTSGWTMRTWRGRQTTSWEKCCSTLILVHKTASMKEQT